MSPKQSPAPVQRIVSIDPGGEHVGWAEFHAIGPQIWECRAAVEKTPEQAADVARSRFTALPRALRPDLVIVEGFYLYADKAMAQTGSTMPTCELIGVFKALCRWGRVPILIQHPSIKVPTFAVARHRAYAFRSVLDQQGGHAKDAEVHGLHYLWRGRGDTVISST